MLRIIGGIMLVGMTITALKLAIVGMILMGLIFRTREMLGLMLLFAVIALLSAYPLAGFGLILTLVLWAWLRPRQQVGMGPSAESTMLLPPPAPTARTARAQS